jgi:uncharacterized protein (DUF2147 family)
MKKLLTLVLALALVALGSISWAATSLNSTRGMQKKPPETMSSNLNSSRSNVYRVKVTQVNEKEKTFAVEINFSAKEVKTLPAVGDVIDIPYTQTPGGPPVAAPTCCTKGSKSNSSDRVANDKDSPKVMTGKVMRVNARDKTFTAEVSFSAKNLKAPLPEVGKIIDITYTQTPGGPLESINLNSSKSNAY